MKYTIKKVESLYELEYAFANGFIDLFDECFNTAPYFLKYSDEELFKIYADHYKTGFVLFAYDEDNKMIGFAGSRPILDDEYVADDVKSFFDNPEDYLYHSELGVANIHRGKRIAQILLKESIDHSPVDMIVMRTKDDNEPSIKLHKKMGFEPLGVTQVIKRQDTNGDEIVDKRIYMVYDKKQWLKTFNPTNLRINVEKMKANLDAIQEAIGNDVEIMPIVKGHAYGIGFRPVSEVIKDCRIAGVATVAEALTLKKFFDGDVFLLYQPCLEDIPYICENGFEIGVSNNLKFLQELNKRAFSPVKIHLNVETGSGMLGIQLPDLKEYCENIKTLENIEVSGIYMHYSCTESDVQDDIYFSNKQSELFEEAIKIAEGVLGEIKYKHAGCSSATFLQPATKHNMVRIGMLFYGYYPSDNIKPFVKIQPALKLTTKITQIADYPAGYSIGYGRMYKTTRPTKVATIGGGYVDGIHRALFEKGEIVINNQKAPILGRPCMDITMVDITDIKGEVNYGDEVALWDNDIITIHEFAKKSETNIAECMVHAGQALNSVVDNEV